MAHPTAKTPVPALARLTGLLALLAFSLAPALAQAPPPTTLAQLDPSDLYFQGYLAVRAAEKLEADGDAIAADEKLDKARKLFDSVRLNHSAWKPEMVQGRSAKTLEAIARVRPKADLQRQKNRNVVAELEGGSKISGTLDEPPATPPPPAPTILEVDPIAARRLAEAEAEVNRLKALMKEKSANDNATSAASREASRARDLALQRDAIQPQLTAAENTVRSLSSRLAASPMESEMKALNQKISGLEQEREAMGMALSQSRNAHTEALSRIEILQADLKIMQQKRADLDRDLKVERNVASAVVAGQRSQLQALEKELEKKNGELAKANDRITGLINELQESRDAFAQLRTERDTLLQERDQMSAMLKLNEDGRIQDLIQQNIGLAKNLREANEKVKRLDLDNNSAKDDITDALRDLAIAKFQINKLQQEKRDQDKRLAELENRLKGEESALAKGQVAADPAEVAVLRDIIQRQLRIQERRRQAKDLLVEAVKDMGSKDERISQAIQLFDGQEIQLTPDEQRLLADKNVDGEFTSPFAQDRATVGRNTTELNRDVAVFERTAEKSFAAGRYLPTRELFQMVVEQNPGHIPALCKLGVVNLRLKDIPAAIDSFRRAVELDAGNPYAHRMLGFSLMNFNNLPAAEQCLKEAVSLAPDDAKSHLLLGVLTNRLGRNKEAEAHYKSAISADPIPSEPYYNLARLYSQEKRMEESKKYYEKALERGAVPDPALEERLAKS
jgi:tetratricopeptide (TPR) repeat protein